MKKHFSCIILVLVSISAFAQISFEKGYFIDKSNRRIECFIKNKDWKNNPAEFEYRLLTDSVVEKGNLGTVKEFGVTGFSRYVNADTKIDLSPAEIDNFYRKRDPEWSPVHLFLKVLVEGKSNLYVYTSGKTTRFFYSVSDSAINQLIYKEYYVSNEQIAENKKFREQLWNDVRLANARMNSVENIGYYESDLVRYFKKYNEGDGGSSVVFGEKEKKDSFHLRFTPGLNYSWASVLNTDNPDSYTDLGNSINFRIGIEAEIILPFNRNKWGILFDPSYQYFNSGGQYGSLTVKINYQSVEFPIGIRHNFFLNEKLKLFVDAFYIPGYSFDFNSKMNDLDIGTRISYAFGGGIAYKKLSTEFRYCTNRDLLKDYISMDSDYRRFSVILGYRIL